MSTGRKAVSMINDTKKTQIARELFQEGAKRRQPWPPARFADGAARPLATHEPLESLLFSANLSAKTLVGAVFYNGRRAGVFLDSLATASL